MSLVVSKRYTEAGIRTTHAINHEISARLSTVQSDIKQKRWYKRMLSKKYRGRVIRYSLLTANALLLVVVVAFVAQKPQAANQVSSAAVPSDDASDSVISPLDELSSADIAVNIAKTVRLPEETSVINKADTVNAQLTIAPSDNVVTAKPQIIATALKSRADIQFYVVQKGDNVSEIAEKFGITSDTLRWSNNLSGDSVDPGKRLVISPINGIVYKVQSGDTAASLASKFRANKDQIIVFNDVEGRGLPVGEYIVIPNGSPQAVAGTPSVANVATAGGFAWGGFDAQYGSNNGYDYGYCTWYAKERRPDLPNNLGNASTWKILAQRAGFSTGSEPRAGAVIWTPPRDYYGHVGYVESVSGGNVYISEMNTAGWGVVSHKTLTLAEARNYGYIY